jgi:hypothetical protein
MRKQFGCGGHKEQASGWHLQPYLHNWTVNFGKWFTIKK